MSDLYISMALQVRFVELESDLGRWRYSTVPGTSGLRGYLPRPAEWYYCSCGGLES